MLGNDTESQLKNAQEEISRLKSAQRDLERNLAYVLERLSQHQAQLNTHQTTIVRLDRVFADVTGGRTWRTLRAIGNLVKRFVPSAAEAHGPRNTYLFCDEPAPNDTTPRSGIVRIRGWALAEGGVDSLELELPGLESQTAKPDVLRPDIKKAYPALDQTGRSGFLFEVDTLRLPPGHHPFIVRLRSGGAAIREVHGSLEIDHEKGFASDYDRWIKEFEKPEDELISLKVKHLTHQPLVSILMPVYNSKPEELTAALESVFAQSYLNWQLCIADDASTSPPVRDILQNALADERYQDRIKVTYRSETGGIARATNSARQLATGDYICFLDHDDVFSPHALAYVVQAINEHPAAQVLYSDEDKIDEAGRRSHPFFKPDWSPDTLLSLNYVCHLFVLKREFAESVGDLDPACDGGQDYDLILRATALASHIHHIPHVLYHWRVSAFSTATTIDNKNFAVKAAETALKSHIAQSGLNITITPGSVPARWRARYNIPKGSKVSIIIASGGKADILRTNLDSLFSKTRYQDFEVVVADNSKGTLIEKLFAEYSSQSARIRYFDWRDKPFNYSVINNTAARSCNSSLLLFLNDDTSVIEADWLSAMVEQAARPEVGAVGAKLLYPTGGIQHGGVVMGIYDNCGHAFKGMDGAVSHYFDFSDVIRNVSAVTGACLMSRADVFWQVGGFDENQFAVAFNDIDLCLKIGAAGYRVIYTPHAVLYHHEAFSKTTKDLIPHPEEVASMRQKWAAIIAHDPNYNPNLTRNDENYAPRTGA